MPGRDLQSSQVMPIMPTRARNDFKELSLSSVGYGPLLQRDYWAVISRSRMKPSEIMDWVGRHFSEFSPRDRAVFSRAKEGLPPKLGEQIRVKILGAGSFRVKVLHRSKNSFTLGTISGHPEAGRITFGAYRNSLGDVVFHIRSRARSSARLSFLGFRMVGEAMQTHTWTDFVNNVALSAGDGVIGYVHAETEILPERFRDNPSDKKFGPTFVARSD
jgi:hypothetical protein